MKKTPKVRKINAAELSEMIRKEVVSVLKEVDKKGTPDWDITKTMKVNKDVQPPKEVEGGDTAPKTLKDMMGMGGEEVLVAPDDKIPGNDKDADMTQLEPSAKPVKEAKQTQQLPTLKENSFLMHDIMDTDNYFRL